MSQSSEDSQSKIKSALRALPHPEPAPGLDAYYKERELALNADPKKRENYELFLSSARRVSKIDYLPIMLDIENVSRCNFRCVMCSVSSFPKGKRAEDMPLSEFKKLIDEEYGLVEIKLHGVGEPLLQGDDYFSMVRYARSKHIWVRVVTNASLLHQRENYKKLVDSGINEIQISVDGSDQETFGKIRVGGVLQKVKDNCKLVNDYCRSQNKTITKMWTVVQRDNAHQLEALVDLAAEVGFPTQVFSLQMHSWGSIDWEEKNSKLRVDEKILHERLFNLIERGARQGVKVWFWNITEKYSTESPETLCPWPFERGYITSDLRNVPCCMISNPDAYEIGRGKSFAKAWTSDEYVQFREDHLTGNIPQVCQMCYRKSGSSNGS